MKERPPLQEKSSGNGKIHFTPALTELCNITCGEKLWWQTCTKTLWIKIYICAWDVYIFSKK